MSSPSGDNGRRPIVTTPDIENFGVGFAKFMAVWMLSAFVNVGLIVAGFIVFSLLGLRAEAVEAPEAEVAEHTEVEDVEKTPDLTNTDLGLDDTLTTQYNVDRIEEVSVPGRVDPTAPVGIVNAPEGPPTTLPPPPGSGGGTGGAPVMAEAGTGAMFGTIGGMGGMYNVGGFGGRSGATREKMLQEGGGNNLSEATVAKGLEWLALHQAQEGYWSLNSFNKHARTLPWPSGKVSTDNSVPGTSRNDNVAGTAFALLPFLAAGQTHRPAKKTTQKDYSKGIGAGLQYLIKVQSKTGDARTRGFYGGGMYSHGLATIAMCEAYGLTSDPVLKASAQMAINYIQAAQDPAGGGWRYSFGQAGDTSVTGWQLMALKSGQMSGLIVDKKVLKAVEKYLDSCETSDKGGFSYTPGSGASPAMTAVGLLCRQYLGVNPRNPALLKGIDSLKKTPPGAGNLYYEYYATQVMHHMGGEAWAFWNLGPAGTGKGGIRDTLIAKQDKGTRTQAQAGTWPGDEHVGGRLGATSLSLLSLEVYYRHLPLYRRDTGVMKTDK